MTPGRRRQFGPTSLKATTLPRLWLPPFKTSYISNYKLLGFGVLVLGLIYKLKPLTS